MSTHANVFVIGAGPAGLTAAYCLTKEDPSVIVIEKDPVYVGGISRTVEYNGFMFDIGGHRFFSKSKEVVDLWKEILPDDADTEGMPDGWSLIGLGEDTPEKLLAAFLKKSRQP